jgi:agmatinase
MVPGTGRRRLTALNIVSADVIDLAPPFDHGEITSLAAATVIFDLITLLARRRQSAA